MSPNISDALVEALEEILTMAADREDIRDTPSGRQAPNDWMRVAQLCRYALQQVGDV